MANIDTLERLVEIMAILRGEGGCPWDREQTHRSLRPYLLEETYEVLDRIDNNQWDQLADELGDLLLQIVFHAQMASEIGTFTISDVIQRINQKLIRRHPHIFGNAVADTSKEVVHRWEQIKQNESKQSVLGGVPPTQPALNRAFRVQEKAAGVGFEWTDIEGVWDKVSEELNELKQAESTGTKNRIEEEIGDLLFSLVNLSRFLGVNPEDSLRGTIAKFIRRFKYVESEMEKTGSPMNQENLAQMDKFWEEAKTKE